MESHVNGGITPLSLGELRQALSAVYFGNPVFTDEEQLQANHTAHECEDIEQLAQLLSAARLEDAQRGARRRQRTAIQLDQTAVCLNKDAQQAEMMALLKTRKLDVYQQGMLMSFLDFGATTQMGFLGVGYQMLLERLGGYEHTRRGWNAIYDN